MPAWSSGGPRDPAHRGRPPAGRPGGEIIGRVDSATAELAALVGLNAGRVRLAGFNSVMSSLVPQAATVLAGQHPGLELGLTDSHPEDALELLRAGQVDVAVIFRYDDTVPGDGSVRLTHLLDDPLYLLTTGGGTLLADHASKPWIAGCERCRRHLVEMCERAGFSPRLAYTTDDMVVMQNLVAAGMGVTTIPGLALRAHQHPAVTATPLPTPPRRIYAATYGEPPDPLATAALLDAPGRALRAWLRVVHSGRLCGVMSGRQGYFLDQELHRSSSCSPQSGSRPAILGSSALSKDLCD